LSHKQVFDDKSSFFKLRVKMTQNNSLSCKKGKKIFSPENKQDTGTPRGKLLSLNEFGISLNEKLYFKGVHNIELIIS